MKIVIHTNNICEKTKKGFVVLKIGYQGDIGSNSEEAAKKFVEREFKHRSSVVEFIPLISSENVIKAVLNGEVNYGVCAFRSCTDYDIIRVNETEHALVNTSSSLEVVSSMQMPIHHCLFVLPNLEADDVVAIASHEQAQLRTIKSRARICPQAETILEKDTAWCARALRSGELPGNYGVICRQETGEKYNLKLIGENIEDEPIRTEFMLLKKYEE